MIPRPPSPTLFPYTTLFRSLQTLFKDVAHEYVETCNVPQQAAVLIDRAVRVAVSQRTVTAVIVPNDVQEMPYEEDRKSTRLNSSHVEISYAVFCLKKKITLH